MRIISKTIYLSSVFFLVYPTASFASLSSEYASLVDTSQNQTFESRPQAAAIPKRPVPSSFAGLVLQRQEPLKYYPKFANVKFIVGDGELDFGYTQMICASKPVMFITVVRPGISKMTNALMTANLFVTVSIPISGVRTTAIMLHPVLCRSIRLIRVLINRLSINPAKRIISVLVRNLATV